MENNVLHQPVMLREVLTAFSPKPGGSYIDATVGDGGHAQAILERTAPDGKLLGLDRDAAMAERARKRLAQYGERCIVVADSYVRLAEHAARSGFTACDGILFDLGVASFHFSGESGRGFSFRTDEALDMRFSPEEGRTTAARILERSSQDELERIFTEYGEEREARRIANAIVRNRPIRTTRELSELVTRVKRQRYGSMHPATKVFQALRIVVNEELRAFELILPQTIGFLRAGGVLGILAYHSLEDRIAKHFMKAQVASGTFELLTVKPIRPTADEVFENPRARSVRFRAAQRL